jgi:probable F420-dependent oxidoreductase
MHLAYQAWDLQNFSKGKFLLGIGSQVKAHIEKRFGVEFSPPAARMRDYILALKAIFEAWQSGSKLEHRGPYYQHTLMTPMFNPGPNDFGPPPILLGALGPRMTEVAGEVADGLIVHPFNSMPFLLDHTLPAVDRGLEKSGRDRENFILQVNAIVITGESAKARSIARESVKSLLGFYASTPAYRPPMEAVGFGDLQTRLNQLSKEGKWDELASHISDDFVNAFTTQGEPENIASRLRDKYGAHADRLAIYAPYSAPDSMWKKIIGELKQG